jgi:hypothetical protein
MGAIAVCGLKSKSPVSFGKYIQEPKLPRETHDDYEKRTWKLRCHTDTDGNVIFLPLMFKNSLSEAARYISMQVPGRGKSTYTKNIESGVLVLDPSPVGIHIDDVKGEWRHVPSDGKRGGTKRVLKCFPVIQNWKTTVTYHIYDDAITKDVFEKHLKECGNFIGVGSFRPRNNGFFGRFDVEGIDWKSNT